MSVIMVVTNSNNRGAPWLINESQAKKINSQINVWIPTAWDWCAVNRPMVMISLWGDIDMPINVVEILHIDNVLWFYHCVVVDVTGWCYECQLAGEYK